MTTITSIESGKTVDVELIDERTGGDMMPDVLGGCGIRPSMDDESDWEVDEDEELDWWVSWSVTEPLIWAARDEADDKTIAADDELISRLGHDLGELQDAECRLFGIEH